MKTLLKAKSTLSEARWRVLPVGNPSHSTIPECPKGQEENEWIAAKAVSFYLDLSTLVQHVSPELTKQCKKPGQGFPPGFKFLWVEDTSKEGVLLTSPNYMKRCLNWMSKLFDDEAVFPISVDQPFPEDFIELHVCKLFTLMFRVFAILYNSGYKYLKKRNANELFFATLKHFVFFGIRYNLLVETDEFLAMKSPMRRLQEEYIKEWKHTHSIDSKENTK